MWQGVAGGDIPQDCGDSMGIRRASKISRCRPRTAMPLSGFREAPAMIASACQELWRSRLDRQKREPRLDEVESAEKHEELLDAGRAVPIV